MQQAGKQVVKAQVDAHGGHYIVRFPAVDNPAYIEEDKAGEQQYRNSRDSERGCRNGKEQVGDGCDYQQHQSYEQEVLHETEVLFSHCRDGCQGEEDGGSSTGSNSHQLRTVLEVKRILQHRPKPPARNEGKQEEESNSYYAVTRSAYP